MTTSTQDKFFDLKGTIVIETEKGVKVSIPDFLKNKKRNSSITLEFWAPKKFCQFNSNGTVEVPKWIVDERSEKLYKDYYEEVNEIGLVDNLNKIISLA